MVSIRKLVVSAWLGLSFKPMRAECRGPTPPATFLCLLHQVNSALIVIPADEAETEAFQSSEGLNESSNHAPGKYLQTKTNQVPLTQNGRAEPGCLLITEWDTQVKKTTRKPVHPCSYREAPILTHEFSAVTAEKIRIQHLWRPNVDFQTATFFPGILINKQLILFFSRIYCSPCIKGFSY